MHDQYDPRFVPSRDSISGNTAANTAQCLPTGGVDDRRPFAKVVDLLLSEVNDLEHSLTAHEERIEPSLTPDNRIPTPPSDKTPGPSRPQVSAAVTAIQGQADRLNALVIRLRRLTARVEL